MPIDRFMIAPINSGLETDIKPFLIPDDAFSQMNNAYVFRGRVRKRFGSLFLNNITDDTVAQQYSRLRINIGNTPGPLNIPGTSTQLQIGQMFSVGDDMFTVFQLGPNVLTLSTNVTATARINSTTNPNTVTFTGEPAATAVYYYPSTPVMGFVQYETGITRDEPTFAFDTQFAYQYTGGAWARLGTAIWTGNDSQFFWGATYRGVNSYNAFLFVSNFNVADNIKYWNGAAATWTNFSPIFNQAGDFIQTALIILPFHDRLILLNTIENVASANQSFINRCRFSQNGDPTQAGAGVGAWLEDTPGKGGYLDAPIKESIVTAEFLKDRLIVYFEYSTWELVYTGNEILPFRWQQINTELGAESTFSVVPFDKITLGIGSVGIHGCNGANVERIDQKIPDSVFTLQADNNGIFRVWGIRDYFVEMVYWTFPSQSATTEFPNQLLVYNYKTGSWSFNYDSITAFGYFYNQSDSTWASVNEQWQQMIQTWNSADNNSEFPNVIAGNQEGYTFICSSNETRNAPSLQITNLTIVGSIATLVIINHNLLAANTLTATGDYIIIENTQGLTGINGLVFPVDTIIDANTITIELVDSNGNPIVVTGTYLGGGTVARVSNIDIYTKQYNFYMNKGRNAYISQVNFYVDITSFGQITVDTFTSSSTVSLVRGGAATGSLVGTSVLETSPYATVPYESTQDRLWHPVYFQADGECIQLRLYMSDPQLRNTLISWSDFELNAMIFYAQPTSFRLQ